MNNPKSGGSAKYTLSPHTNSVHGRFSRLYEAGTSGKGVLVAQCVAGGMMLKECGILDTIIMLDQHPAYLEGTPSVRRTILINELIALLGQSATSHPVSEPVAAAPVQAAVGDHQPQQTLPASEQVHSSPATPPGPKLPKLGL